MEELYEVVYSPKLTAVEAAQFEGTTQGTTERLVQRIPYAVLCQQLQQERLSVKEEVSKAVQACERKVCKAKGSPHALASLVLSFECVCVCLCLCPSVVSICSFLYA